MSASRIDRFTDRWPAAPPVYLTNLDKCRPAEALSREARRGHWRTLAYETDGSSGVMLIAGPETAAPEITYPLQASGWHAVSVGMYVMPGATVKVPVRLSGDPAFSILTLPQLELGWTTHTAAQEQIWEQFWKVADLTDQQVVLGQVSWRVTSGDEPGSLQGLDAAIAYIKLVPLSEAEVGAVKADRSRIDTRRLFAHNDAHGPHWLYRLTDADGIRRELEPYRDTDFSRIYWEGGHGDLLHYFTKIGQLPTSDGAEDFGRQGDRRVAESWRIFRDQGVDPFAVAIDHAHEIGLELHAGYRVAGFHQPPPLPSRTDDTGFYRRHPELRGIDRNGDPTPRIAYTYPETREFVVSVLREMAGYPINGICLMYNRRLPLVEYEPPLVEGFKTEYGEDPRRLDEKDPRWLAYRTRILTQFMREVREAMDAAAREQGRSKPIEVSAIVMGLDEENLFNGIDVRTWVNEGLVDTLIPYSSHPNWGSNAESWTEPRDIAYWVGLTAGTSCRLAPNIMPRHLSSEAYRRRAASLYDAGVENLYFWDTVPYHPGSWDGLRRLGHREEIEAWTKAGEPSLATPHVPLTKLGDWSFGAYGTGE